MITKKEVAEIKRLSFEALIYELLDLVNKHFEEKSSYALAKFVVLEGLIKDELVTPFEAEDDSTTVGNTKT